jgi:hypothetical protein
MISRYLRPISRLGLSASHLIASATGCLVFIRGFRLVAMNKEESHSALPMRNADGPPKSSAGIGAALLLLTFISSEAVATVLSLRR